MASSPRFDGVIIGTLFVVAVIIEGVILLFVEPAGNRLLFGMLTLLPIMWPVVWATGHFGYFGIAAKDLSDPSQRRKFLRLRALTAQLIENIRRLNWLSVDALRGLRRSEDIASDLDAVKRRLHEIVDRLPEAAGLSETAPKDAVDG